MEIKNLNVEIMLVVIDENLKTAYYQF